MSGNIWTDELKQTVIDTYTSGDPTPENTISLLEALAKEHDFTVNGVRMILTKAGVYVKKDKETGSGKKTDKPKRKSKQDSIDDLTAIILSNDIEVDETVVDKMTGKAAEYFIEVIKNIAKV